MIRHVRCCPVPSISVHCPCPPGACPLQEALDEELAAVFGTADLNSGKTLGLTEFLGCLHAHQLQQLRSRPTMKLRQANSGGPAASSAAAAAAIAAK